MVTVTIRSLVLLLLPALVWGANIEVSTDRDPVALEESFQIVFRADGSVDDDPDFAPLDKDFQVLSSGQSSNISIVNGRISSEKTWTLTALARRQGKLVIPPIWFGKDISPPLRLTVTDRVAAGASRASDDIFLEAEVNPTDPLVQSQVIYRIKLYLAVAPANASLSEPEVLGGDAVIERLGDDRRYRTRIRRRTFDVIERDYAIYPQSSGTLTIAPIRFQGQVGSNSLFRFDPFGPQPKTVIRQSRALELEVKPVPEGFSGGTWLPARALRLTESWSADPPVLRVGEPVTRTLTLEAEGLTASQLPELSGPLPDNLKYYPDQPKLDDTRTQAGISGRREEKQVIIPNQTGEVVIPAIRIPWWDITRGTVQYAEIPQRRFVVSAAADAQGNPLTPPPLGELDTPAPAQQPPTIARETGGSASAEPVTTAAQTPVFWQYLSVALVVVWLLTLLVLWRGWRRGGKDDVQDDGAAGESMAAARRALKQACATNDPVAAKQALLIWAGLNWPQQPPHSIGHIVEYCSPELALPLRELNTALYSRERGSWRGEELWRVFNTAAARKRQVGQADDGELQPLYRL